MPRLSPSLTLTTIAICAASFKLYTSEGQAKVTELDEVSMQAPIESCFGAKTPVELAETLKERAAQIALQEEALREKQAKLDAAKKSLTAKISELSEAKEQLQQTISLADSAAEDDLSRLTEAYNRMNPESAATLFSEMAVDFAAGFIGRLSPDAVAQILAAMEPEKAYEISASLAGRNANQIKD